MPRFVANSRGNADDEIPHVLDTASRRNSQVQTHTLVANNPVVNINAQSGFSTERKEGTLMAEFQLAASFQGDFGNGTLPYAESYQHR